MLALDAFEGLLRQRQNALRHQAEHAQRSLRAVSVESAFKAEHVAPGSRTQPTRLICAVWRGLRGERGFLRIPLRPECLRQALPAGASLHRSSDR